MSDIRSLFTPLKKYQRPLEKYVFPLVLLLYPLLNVTAGADITDTGYNLTNFEFVDGLDPMWFFSTYLSNIIGNFIINLPCAETMMGMRVYCSLIISLTALISYYFLQRSMPGWMIFIGAFIAESLCWCPTVILYNYLTYLFFTLGTVFLLKGIFDWREQRKKLFIAGVFFGINILVRFSNAPECMMILVLWFYDIITKDRITDTIKKTLSCIAGYICGFGIPILFISGKYGMNAYPNAIGELFGMTQDASDYSSSGMLTDILNAYRTSFRHMIIIIPCVIAGIVMFKLYGSRYVVAKRLLYIAGLFVLLKFYFSRGVFTTNYFYYDSMEQAATMFIIIAVIFAILGSIGYLNGSKEEQTLAFCALMIILLVPIGSNNRNLPLVNNMFLVAPISLWLYRRLIQRLGEAEWNFAWQSTFVGLVTVLVVQGILFHLNFSFVDGMDGAQKRDHVIKNIPKVKGMVTTEYNAETLEELALFMENNVSGEDKVITFGSIPGISYLFDLEPAINTSWPNLDSYVTDKYKSELERAFGEGKKPVIIIGKNEIEAYFEDEENDGSEPDIYANAKTKYSMLLDYIDEYDYNIVFESDRFVVYTPGQHE